MIKIKLKALPLLLIILLAPMIISPILQKTQAIPPEFQEILDDKKGHQIIVYEDETMTFTTSEWSYVKHGWVDLTQQEKGDLEPFNVEIYINGIEIELRSFTERIGRGSDTIFNIWFYQTFDSGQFNPGIYNWTVVWTDVTGIVSVISSPLTILNTPHQIIVYQPETMIFTASERCFVKHGWVELSQPEFNDLEPFNVQIFIDGLELDDLYYVTERVQNTYNVYFYKYFDQNYFAPGIYNWTVVWRDNTGIVSVLSHPLVILDDSHRLKVVEPETMIITTSERCFVRQGFSWPAEFHGTDHVYSALPFNVQLYVDQEEIELYQKFEIEYDEQGNPLNYYLFFYKYFDAHYFVPGIYNWTVVWTDSEQETVVSNPLIVLKDPHRLNSFDPNTNDVLPESLIISTSERCYIRHGWMWTAEQFGDEVFYDEIPYNVQIYIDEQEIELTQKLEIEYDEHGNPSNYYLYFYKYFDAYYFTPGFYNLTVVWSFASNSILTNSHPLTVLTEPHQLNIFNQDSLSISTMERCYIIHGWWWTAEQFEDDNFYNDLPLDVQLFIDGQEIELYQKFEIEYDEQGNPLNYYLFYYRYFDSFYFSPDRHGYFPPGEYELTVIWSDSSGQVFIENKILSVHENGQEMLDQAFILESERSFIYGFFGWNEENFGSELFYNQRPYMLLLDYNGNEVPLYQKLVIYSTSSGIFYHFYFYQTFEEYFFAPDSYLWTYHWSWGTGSREYYLTTTILTE